MNCKPGDLAIVIASPEVPENIGAIVEVIRPSDPCPCGCTEGRIVWMVHTQGRPLLGYGAFNLPSYASELNVADAYLKPISGLPAAEVDQMVQRVGPAPTVPALDGTYGLLAVSPGEEPAFYDADLRPICGSGTDILQGVAHG